MKKVFIPAVFLIVFALLKVNAQNNNYNSKVYYDTYNNITKYYEKPAATTNYNYNTPSTNYNTPTYNSYSSGNYSNSYSSYNSYPDPASPTYYAYAKMHFAKTAEGTGVDDKFRVTKSDGILYGFLTHPAGIQTTSFIVKYYKVIEKKSTFMEEITYYMDKKDYTSVWFQYDFSKFGDGKYYMSAYTTNGVLITGGSLTIKADFSIDVPVKNDTYTINSPANTGMYRTPESEHYKSSKVVFCQSIKEGKPEGIYTNFVLTPGGGVVYTYITNDLGMNSKLVSADVHKEVNGEYIFMEKKDYTFAESYYTMVWFEYDYSKFGAGKYRFDFFNTDNVFINSGYVTISSP